MTYIKTRLCYIAGPPGPAQAKVICVQPRILVGAAWMHGSSRATHVGTAMERLMLLLWLLLLLLEGVVRWVHATRVGNLKNKYIYKKRENQRVM